MKKKVSTAILTIVLMALGLSSDLAKDIAVKTYCAVQPHDCSKNEEL